MCSKANYTQVYLKIFGLEVKSEKSLRIREVEIIERGFIEVTRFLLLRRLSRSDVTTSTAEP